MKKEKEDLIRRLEEEKIAKEERDRLSIEENEQKSTVARLAEQLHRSLEAILKREDWERYASTETNYIEVSSKREVNRFIYEFKERIDKVDF